ncbi:hypothetical protein HYU50_00950 [Candidatus Woesearchaeota archaeon]|nr:hypothetical protein [Candidatus Woesearchaeota archaeon]
MTANDDILNLVKQKGPILPAQVSKHIKDNILMTSARLSELLSNKKIKISSIKVGGSPLYYVDGQESKLQNYADNLGSKEKEAYNLLKEKKVLRDSALEPAIRVALRIIKDFSIPLQVNYDNRTEVFWKWYLAQNNETQEIIRQILSKKEEIVQQKIQAETQKKEITKEDAIQKESIAKKYETQSTTQKQDTTEKQDELIQKTAETTAKTGEDTAKKPDIKREQAKKPGQTIDKNYLLNKTSNFFNRNKINKIDEKEIKKNSEMDFIVELETSIGKAKYFCKSKNRKKVNESDLSTAMMQAQSKGLPLIFVTTGKISKKAKEMLNTDFKNIIYKEI